MIVKEDFCLKPFNTFGVEVLARKAAIITSVRDLMTLFNQGYFEKEPLILSKGSNVLLTDHVMKLVVLNQIWGKEIIDESEEIIHLRINAGEFWPSLVDYTVENGWGGLENMTDIPGKVGAAPIQNIGAYGAELSDVLVSVDAFNFKTGKVETFSNEMCEFGYRTSIFKTKLKGKYFITSILIRLSKKPLLNISYGALQKAFEDVPFDKITIADISRKVSEIRASKLPDPEKLNNAGSFFKNPVVSMSKFHDLKLEFENIPNYPQKDTTYKIPAGWLIEQCGWKGKRIGNVGVHEKQALVIVKYDTASGREILNLANKIMTDVKSKFGIELEMEVNVY